MSAPPSMLSPDVRLPGPAWREEDALPSLVSWEPDVFTPVTPLDDARRREVLLLAERARGAEGAERDELAGQLGLQIETLGRGRGSREVADLLLHLLEDGRLEGLWAEGRRTCRSVAVESLTHLGYPYALEVHPEDLEHLRAYTRRSQGSAWARSALSAGVLGAGFVGQWLSLPPEVASAEGLTPFLVLLMGLSGMGLLMALLAPARSPSRQAGLFVLALLSLVEVFLGGPAGYHGAASGLAGLVACLLLVLSRR